MYCARYRRIDLATVLLPNCLKLDNVDNLRLTVDALTQSDMRFPTMRFRLTDSVTWDR
jgi:hypothetical protein